VNDISTNINNHMVTIIGHNVNFFLNHGGYKIGNFKLNSTSPELVALCSMANTKEFQAVIRSCKSLYYLCSSFPS
jgi:hypothetical protein